MKRKRKRDFDRRIKEEEGGRYSARGKLNYTYKNFNFYSLGDFSDVSKVGSIAAVSDRR